MAAPQTKFEWSAPEYEFRKKGPDWFWAVGVITLTAATSSFFLQNFIFAGLVIIMGFSLALYGAKKPDMVNFKIDATGIKIGSRVFDYQNLKSFWIEYDPPIAKELLVESKKTFVPHIKIQLGDQDPVKIRAYLLQFLKEEKIEESLIIAIARLLNF